MSIESVNRNAYVQNQAAASQKSSSEQVASNETMRSNPRTDRLELSYLAIKFKPIREKLKSGEYSKPEIIRAVASKIAAEIPAPAKVDTK
ncbi:MAG: hypothetical protein GX121_09965 [Ignavibacteria bacterium]|nr:hypothetical protein [Ignavibacteria bacterium]